MLQLFILITCAASGLSHQHPADAPGSLKALRSPAVDERSRTEDIGHELLGWPREDLRGHSLQLLDFTSRRKSRGARQHQHPQEAHPAAAEGGGERGGGEHGGAEQEHGGIEHGGGDHGRGAEHGGDENDGGEHGGERSGGEEKIPPDARAYAVSLMGAIVVVMSIFYLVNWDDPDIRLSTWQTLSMTVSIFVSVLLYGTILEALKSLMGIESERGVTFLNLALFFVLYFLLQAALYLLAIRTDKQHAHAAGVILAHITGFAAMYCGAGLLVLKPFAGSLTGSVLLVVLLTVGISGLAFVGTHFRRQAALVDDGCITEDEEEWMEEVEEVEDDVFSLCLGFCLMQILRHSLTGKSQPFEAFEEPTAITQRHTYLLLGCSLMMAALTCLFAWISRCLREWQYDLGPHTKRLLDNLRNVSSTTMAWCVLFWGEWQIYVLGFESVRIAGLLLLAISMSILCCVLIFVLDWIADRSEASGQELRTLILSLGLLIGFTWERAFDIGLEQFSVHHSGSYYGLMRHTLPIVFALLVLPAWSLYILPNAMEAKPKTPEPAQKEKTRSQKLRRRSSSGLA